MKRSLFVIAAVILLIGTLTAQPNEFELLGQGQFSGKLGSYVSGDTIFCVYNTATLASGTGSVILKASYDGGETWQSHTVALSSDSCTALACQYRLSLVQSPLAGSQTIFGTG